MTGHGVRLTEDGRLALFRTAPIEDVDRLRRTVESLRKGAGAGAVDIVHVTDDGKRIELVLAFAGRPPTAPMRAEELAPLSAALAAHLSDLHQRGLAHGAVRHEHVLVDADRRVRLCGFGDAHRAQPTDDVQAFGTLIRELLDDDDRSVTAHALRFQADRCRVDEAVRPSMAAIAASLASIDGPVRAVSARTTATSRRRRRPVGIAVAAVVVVAILFAARPLDSRTEHHPTSSAPPTTDVPMTTTTAKQATRVWPARLQGDGSTWDLGAAGDRRLLGDWNCDGLETPALFERATGAVWVADSWPQLEAAARYVTTITGVIDVQVESGPRPACDGLVVVTEDGDTIRVSLSA